MKKTRSLVLTFWPFTILLFASIILALEAVAQDRPPVVKIGAVYALTGDIGTYGQESTEAIKMAVAELNKRKAKKYHYELFIEDNRSASIESANAVKKLIAVDKVVAILGSVASNNTLAQAPVAQAKKIPLVTTGSTSEKVTKQGEFIFRTCFVDNFQGTAAAKFAFQGLKARRVAVVIDNNSDYSRGIAKSFNEAFRSLGGEIVKDSFAYQRGQKDFRSLVRRVQRKRPDLVYIPGYYSEVGPFLKQAEELQLKVPFLGSDGWASPDLLTLAGEKAAAGHFMTSHFSPDFDDPLVKNFVRTYGKKYKKVPGAFAALAYDGMKILAQAIEAADKPGPQLIRDQLAKIKDFKGVTGSITINEKRDADKSVVILKTTKDQFTYLTSIDPD